MICREQIATQLHYIGDIFFSDVLHLRQSVSLGIFQTNYRNAKLSCPVSQEGTVWKSKKLFQR